MILVCPGNVYSGINHCSSGNYHFDSAFIPGVSKAKLYKGITLSIVRLSVTLCFSDTTCILRILSRTFKFIQSCTFFILINQDS